MTKPTRWIPNEQVMKALRKDKGLLVKKSLSAFWRTSRKGILRLSLSKRDTKFDWLRYFFALKVDLTK